eukprot:8412394-Pyramimonas_sp.AAC.1
MARMRSPPRRILDNLNETDCANRSPGGAERAAKRPVPHRKQPRAADPRVGGAAGRHGALLRGPAVRPRAQQDPPVGRGGGHPHPPPLRPRVHPPHAGQGPQ